VPFNHRPVRAIDRLSIAHYQGKFSYMAGFAESMANKSRWGWITSTKEIRLKYLSNI